MSLTLEGSLPLHPMRERCGMCHRVNPVQFHVPPDVWLASVPEEFEDKPLCILCFADLADERLVPWALEIEFYPVSLASRVRPR